VIELPVLNYHGIEGKAGEYDWLPEERPYAVRAAVFEEQIRVLGENGFVSVNLELMASWQKGGESVSKPLMLTFDDGHISHYEHATEILSRHGAKGLFFISSFLVGKPGYMSWQHLKDLSDRGFEIGCHGCRHKPLAGLPQSELEEEVTLSRKTLQDRLGIEIKSMSLPGGFDSARVRQAVKDAGYDYLFTSSFGLNQPGCDLFRLKRMTIKNNTPAPTVAEWCKGNTGASGYIEAGKETVRNLVPPKIYSALSKIKMKWTQPS